MRRIVSACAMAASGVALFLVEMVAIATSRAPYDALRQAVSDLGVTACGPLRTYDPPVEVCSPSAGAVNTTWIVTGLLVAMAIVILRPRRTGATGVVAVVLVVLAGLLQASVGVVPVDVHLEAHILLAFGGFLAQIVALPLYAVAAWRDSGSRIVVIVSVLSGAAMLVGLVLVVLTTAGVSSAPLGITERFIIYPFQVWMIVVGVEVLRIRR